MTPAAALLAELAGRGVSLEARGADLVLRPRGVLDADLLERLRAAKPDLLAVLSAEALADIGPHPSAGAAQKPAQGPLGGRTLDLVFAWGAEARDGGARSSGELAGELLKRPATQKGRRAAGEVAHQPAVLPEGADPDDPPPGWSYCPSGRLAGCWVGPGGELAPGESGRAGRGL